MEAGISRLRVSAALAIAEGGVCVMLGGLRAEYNLVDAASAE
ncbi:hypothetical protein [Candidatus Viadribacter manganicus]|nr:hypothetical protein [Candidatus Viadribacter manganicus]